jgi:hypothetical protein
MQHDLAALMQQDAEDVARKEDRHIGIRDTGAAFEADTVPVF